LALQIYAEECNSLNRSAIHKIYDEEREVHFNRTLSEAVEFACIYSHLLNEQGLEVDIFAPTPEHWFESLVSLVEQTTSPFDVVEVDSKEALLESYREKYFNITEKKKVGYIPLSKIL
jgi:hypothetical protein